jgi:hypothetical protein
MSQLVDGPEFIVRRQVFDRYFERPLPSSTFHDLVNKHRILACPDIKGHYFLNRSLQQLGLPTVTKLPRAERSRSLDDIVRLAFTIIDPMLFPAPPWMLSVESIDVATVDHARRLADQHREQVTSLRTTEEKLQYFAGVLDAQVVMEADDRL